MLYLLKLAWKNIFRAKLRTILTFLILSFGIAFYIVMVGMIEGFNVASFRNMIDLETGHVKIRSKQYNADLPFDIEHYFYNTSQLEKKLHSKKFIKGMAKRFYFQPQMDNFRDMTPVIAVGIVPEQDKKVFNLLKYVKKGKLSKNGALIGKTLAKDMKLKLGKSFNLSFKNKPGMYTSMELQVSGIIQAPDPKINMGMVFLNLKEVQDKMKVMGVSEITLKTDNYKKAGFYSAMLKKQLPAYQVKNWRELSGAFAAMMQTKKKATSFVLFFIVIIALVGIINTILMSVYEKRQEIGTLMAMGMEHKQVKKLFVFEGFIIGILGSILGVILATGFNLYLTSAGIDYSKLMAGRGADFGFNVLGVIKSTWEPKAYVYAVFIAIIASILASFYPARKAMKMEPAECLRTVQ